jgi:hypothetical protein
MTSLIQQDVLGYTIVVIRKEKIYTNGNLFYEIASRVGHIKKFYGSTPMTQTTYIKEIPKQCNPLKFLLILFEPNRP